MAPRSPVADPLLAHLERARTLGIVGRGPLARHLDHARGFLPALDGVGGAVLDLGSGAGLPGLVIALERPDLHLVLLDAMQKRCRLLEDAVASFGVAGRVTVQCERAELAGRGERRGQVDAVVARSFGAPGPTAECAAPFLRVGGRLVVSEPPDGADRWPSDALAALGLTPRERRSAPIALEVLEQTALCPDRFPRRDGKPTKEPLF